MPDDVTPDDPGSLPTWPRYVVRLSGLKCDLGKTFIWYCWRQGTEHGYWTSIGAYATPEDAVDAANADAARRRDAMVIP